MADAKAAPAERRRKRLKGKGLADLRAAVKCLERAVKSLNGKREEILDAHDAFQDQINWNTGWLYDQSSVIDKKIVWGERIGRIDKSEDTAQKQLRRAMETADSDVTEVLWELARKLGCMPKDIDPASGEIKGTPVDVFDADSAEDVALFRGEAEEEAPEDDVETPAGPADDPIPFKPTGT